MAAKSTPSDDTLDQAGAPGDGDGGAATPGNGSDRTPGGTTADGSPGGESVGRSRTAQPGTPPAPHPEAAGFFGWLRSLGVPRQPGWIGGVSAGVAARLGIDPIIVRGVLVVFAIFATPIFLVYGIAWLLLPDTTGRIHLEQLLRGRFDSAIVGIAIFGLIGLFPAVFGSDSLLARIWSLGSFGGLYAGPWGNLGGLSGVFSLLWTLLLIGAVVALVIWLVRRSRETDGSAGSATGYGSTGYGSTGYGSTPPEEAFAAYEAEATTTTTMPAAASAADAAASEATTVADAEPVAPAQPAGDAASDDYTEWKARYDAWRIEHEAWKRSQAEANRSARVQLAAENKVRAAQFQAQAEQARRTRKLTRPRTSFAAVVASLGGALVAGTLGAIIALGSPAQSAYAVTIGLAVATIVLALSMVVAGALRRRSGFLAFTTVIVLICTLGSAALPRTDRFLLGDNTIRLGGTSSYFLPLGTAYVSVDGSSAGASGPAQLSLTQGAGNVYIDVLDGARVHVVADYGSGGWSSMYTVDADGNYVQDGNGGAAGGFAASSNPDGGTHLQTTVGEGTDPGQTDAVIHIRGLNGGIQIVIHEETKS